jgi:chemotaxis protein MotB
MSSSGGLLVAVGLAFAFAAFPGCVARQTYDKAIGQIELQDGVIDALKQENLDLSQRTEGMARDAELARLDAQKAMGERDSARDAFNALQAQLGNMKRPEVVQAASKDLGGGVTMEMTPEGTRYKIENHVLFDTGKAVVKADGQRTLTDIVIPRLRQDGFRIRVEGHTDNVPIVQPETQKKYPRGNLELSGERALEVATFLIKRGIPANRVAYAGYGEFKPVASNDADKGRAQNRRVEILVLSAQP